MAGVFEVKVFVCALSPVSSEVTGAAGVSSTGGCSGNSLSAGLVALSLASPSLSLVSVAFCFLSNLGIFLEKNPVSLLPSGGEDE
jgi:hypothetical protein